MRRVALLLLALSSCGAIAHAETETAAQQKAVLVTGASTGVGRKITERLAADGYGFCAGARKPQDLEALGKIQNVQPLQLDVTKASDIAAAVESVTRSGRGPHGLVNNAGVAIAGPIAETSEEDFDFVMDVNICGPYRVTKAFAPLLVASNGRITTIGSISGILSSRDLAVYSISKRAIEAFTDSLALQMAPLGVEVSVVEPGNYNSEIGRSAAKRAGTVPRLADRSQSKNRTMLPMP
jgi:NAD(P)-dependent dehydrogenase (short-subunit alcohol dehydrogenase family)